MNTDTKQVKQFANTHDAGNCSVLESDVFPLICMNADKFGARK